MTKNVHDGHRARLLDSVFDAGLEKINDVTSLEFMLTYVIPRKDTNAIAHKLLDKFQTFANVLDADYRQLMEVEGIGERTAKLIALFPAMFEKYNNDKIKKQKSVHNLNELIDICRTLLQTKNREEFYVICLDKKDKILEIKKLSQGQINKVELDKKEFTKCLLNISANKVVLTHCHPNETCKPSAADVQSTDKIKLFLSYLNISVYDHIIIGEDGAYSMNLNAVLEVK